MLGQGLMQNTHANANMIFTLSNQQVRPRLVIIVMWERRSYDDSGSCTVKYKGSIEPWGDQEALGVEWDDCRRGKNNGAVNGIQYFHCTVPGAGAFIKATRKHATPTTFGEAFTAKYLLDYEFEQIQLSGVKRVETYDVESMHNYQAAIVDLPAISLERCLVNSMTSSIDFRKFAHLTKLDLSFNLFADFNDVLDGVAQFPQLKTLRLDGNRFQFHTPHTVATGVEELSMNETLLSEEDISLILTAFPNVKSLSLGSNRLTRVPPLPDLEVLDLSNNPITSLSGLPATLTTVLMSNCDVLDFQGYIPPCIDLRHNNITWDGVSQLTGVQDLWLNAVSDQHRAFIITRCPELTKLDGTPVLEQERYDSELYTLGCVCKKKHPALPEALWKSLISKYGEPVRPPSKSIRARMLSYYVDNNTQPLRITKDAPIFRLHWQIARHKQTEPHLLHIKGITDMERDERDALTGLLEVSDVLTDGQRIETYAS